MLQDEKNVKYKIPFIAIPRPLEFLLARILFFFKNFHITLTTKLILTFSRYTNQRVTSCELISLRAAFIARVTSQELFLLHELQVIVYFTSYKLLFIAPVESYFLHASYSIIFTMSYNRDKDDKAVYEDKVMIKNYSLRSFFGKELRGIYVQVYIYIYMKILCNTLNLSFT